MRLIVPLLCATLCFGQISSRPEFTNLVNQAVRNLEETHQETNRILDQPGDTWTKQQQLTTVQNQAWSTMTMLLFDSDFNPTTEHETQLRQDILAAYAQYNKYCRVQIRTNFSRPNDISYKAFERILSKLQSSMK